MRVTMVLRVIGVAAVGALALVGCGGDGGDSASSTTTAPAIPEECVAPPTTIDLRAGGELAAGAEAFDVRDAVARRVALLPGKMAFDPGELSGLESEAATTNLALYTLYLADFTVPRSVLSSNGFGEVSPGAGKTVGALTLAPTTEAGFVEGAVVTDGEFEFDLTTTLKPLSVTVFADGNTTGQAYTDVVGQATILHLDEEQICVAFDVTLENQGELVYAAKGTVLAPVVKAPNTFFFT